MTRYAREKLRWNGWGSREVSFDTKGSDREVWEFVRGAVGLESLPSTPPRALDAVELPAIRLSPALVVRASKLASIGAVARSYDVRWLL